jgi:hypothetical protein
MKNASVIACGIAACLVGPAHVGAGFAVGQGNVASNWHDGASDSIAVNLSNSQSFGRGGFVTAQFNHDFTNFVAGSRPSSFLTGTFTPVLLIRNGADFTPIVIGDTITYHGPTAGFASTPFGSSETFTLASTTTVYAGLLWHADPHPESEKNLPAENVNVTRNDLDDNGRDFKPGANSPSFDGNDTAVVPVPSSIVMALIGGGMVGFGRLLRRRARQHRPN